MSKRGGRRAKGRRLGKDKVGLTGLGGVKPGLYVDDPGKLSPAGLNPAQEASVRAHGFTPDEIQALRPKVRLADKATLLNETADPTCGLADWQYVSTSTGEKLGPQQPFSQVAKDLVYLAKQSHAKAAREEHMRAHKFGNRPIFAKVAEVGPNKAHVQAQIGLDPEHARKSKEEFFSWLAGPIELIPIQHSVAHRVTPDDLPTQAHILLVNHDWARLMANSDTSGPEGKDGPRLPYPITVFEFLFKGGVHAVCVALQLDPTVDDNIHATTHFKTKSGWVKAEIEVVYDEQGNIKAPHGFNPSNPLIKAYDLITKNVYALCAMLEAEVAEATPTRMDYKRNIAKGDTKPLPALSHHVVSLARRHRTSSSPYPGEEHRGKRLHFRRGHWRHYSNHRTWIKWMLVGDPELGWVEKEYSL